MATVKQWIEGARPRTFPNAVAPVIVGAGLAGEVGQFSWWKSLLALAVSLTLIIGVNFANDYSDGIRGTDADRVGPLRLVGSGLVAPKKVLMAALSTLFASGVFGLLLVALTHHWWLLLLGGACLVGAWFYTGGKHPYGYAGLGELAVFVFFGLAGVIGTSYVQTNSVHWHDVVCAIAIGSFSTAVLTANNLRDIPTDRQSGKKTLAVRLGDRNTRRFYVALIVTPFLCAVLLGLSNPLSLLVLLLVSTILHPLGIITSGTTGSGLVPVLKDTGFAMLAWAVLVAAILSFT
jgi:1,4-dihydroxy-2-naphthoate octaprenyltransferase